MVNRERLSGLLVPLTIGADAHRDYERMNRALAARAEALPVPVPVRAA